VSSAGMSTRVSAGSPSNRANSPTVDSAGSETCASAAFVVTSSGRRTLARLGSATLRERVVAADLEELRLAQVAERRERGERAVRADREGRGRGAQVIEAGQRHEAGVVRDEEARVDVDERLEPLQVVQRRRCRSAGCCWRRATGPASAPTLVSASLPWTQVVAADLRS